MNARFDICQAAHDAKVPPPVSETPEELAKAEWLYNAAEQLVCFGQDVKVRRKRFKQNAVTMWQFALAVDEHVNNRLADCKVDAPSLGWLLITVASGKPCKTSVAELLGHSEHPLGMLGEIAEKLLQPLVEDALIAQAEDDLL